MGASIALGCGGKRSWFAGHEPWRQRASPRFVIRERNQDSGPESTAIGKTAQSLCGGAAHRGHDRFRRAYYDLTYYRAALSN